MSGALGDVSVRRITYRGWPGCYQLSNGKAELVFVPQIGRVMRFSAVGGPNVLWENAALSGKVVPVQLRRREWANYGGDKLWPAPQNHWKWPPDTALDGGPHRVTVLAGGTIRVESPSSKDKGIRFTREISLNPAGLGVTFRNVMENTSDQDVEWSVWEVAQIVIPQHALLPWHAGGRNKLGYYVFKDYAPAPGTVTTQITKNPTVQFKWHPTRSGKIGADSPAGWVRARLKQGFFTISARFEPGQNYPDDGCGQEIWSNAGALQYMELELLGPIRILQPGDKQTLNTTWRLDLTTDLPRKSR
jgi:hypothetical protein